MNCEDFMETKEDEDDIEETYPKFRHMSMQDPSPLIKPSQKQSALKHLQTEQPTVCWTPILTTRDPIYHHPLTKFHTIFEDVDTVVRRVLESNRMRSIEAEYTDNVAIAKCRAARNTNFNVRLFLGDETDEMPQPHIVMDIRRMSGCSLVFHEELRAILRAVRSGEILPRDIDAIARPTHIPDTDSIPLREGSLEQNLLSMKKNLKSDCHDVRLFALEVVASTTNSEDAPDDTALSASKLIMDEKKFGIRESVAWILFPKKKDVFDDRYIRSLALTILSNVLSTLSNSNVLTPFLQDVWYTKSLIPVLVEEIKMAAKHPSNASLAAKCLSVLFANSPDACCKGPDDVRIFLEAAKDVGKVCHVNLEKEARSAIEKMVQCRRKAV